MEYTVVTSKNLLGLILKVNSFIDDGWIPQGGVFETNAKGVIDFYQAMIKKNRKLVKNQQP